MNRNTEYKYQTSRTTRYVDTEAKGSTVFRNPKVIVCGDQSVVREPLMV